MQCPSCLTPFLARFSAWWMSCLGWAYRTPSGRVPGSAPRHYTALNTNNLVNFFSLIYFAKKKCGKFKSVAIIIDHIRSLYLYSILYIDYFTYTGFKIYLVSPISSDSFFFLKGTVSRYFLLLKFVLPNTFFSAWAPLNRTKLFRELFFDFPEVICIQSSKFACPHSQRPC